MATVCRVVTSSCALHLGGDGWGKAERGCGKAWPPANPALQPPASQSCWGGCYLTSQGGCDLLWGGGTRWICNSQVWKAARDVPGATCRHPAWAEPCRWAQGTRHRLALRELILAQRTRGHSFSFHPALPPPSISPHLLPLPTALPLLQVQDSTPWSPPGYFP